MKDIKNIIFDFGGILLNLDPSRTATCFAALFGSQAAQVQAYLHLDNNNIFTDYEVGKIDTATFVAAIQAANPIPTTAEQIETAWSAMLLDFPPQRIALLRELKEAGYRLFLLSNINEIHLRDVRIIMENTLGLSDFDSFFEAVYYSHLIGHRKPEKATYDYVLQQAGIEASESVFVDDTASNLVGARQAGLHTIHHQANSDLNRRLKSYLEL